MPKSSPEKITYAKTLLGQNVAYNEIQEKLRSKFGSGMSNTTLVKMQNVEDIGESKDQKIEELERELKFFKRLYFELLEKTQHNLPSRKRKK